MFSLITFVSIPGGLGAPKVKIYTTNLGRLRCGNLLIPSNQRLCTGQSSIRYMSLRTTSLRSVKAIQLSAVPTAETSGILIFLCFLFAINASLTFFTSDIADVEDSEETKSSLVNTQLIPKSSEVSGFPCIC